MKKTIKLSTLLLWLCHQHHESNALNFPGPPVYVVTPSPRSLQIDEGRSAPRPFYYHNWMRRMDSPQNTTTTTTTTTMATAPKVKTPDLIFAEFESDNMKNIRKLLEKERITSKSTLTSKPIHVVDDDMSDETQNGNYGLPSPTTEKKEEIKTSGTDMTDYFALYNNLYNTNSNEHVPPAPVYLPSTTPSTTTTTQSTTTTTATTAPIHNVENIWHIIDSEKHDQSAKWDEVPVSAESDRDAEGERKTKGDVGNIKQIVEDDSDSGKFDENFALPGFGNGPENESRAIRTEPNIRFPYVNLKPFQMKNLRKPLNDFSNSKKGNNMYTSLDNFFEIKKPVRGEAQDVVPMRQPIDRYNPAQPYLPGPTYGSNSKQSGLSSPPVKTVANLVPPPPPPAPKVTADDFPAPTSYESFPPYAAPSGPDFGPQPAPPPGPKPLIPMPQPPPDSSDDSDSPSPADDGPPMDVGYRYKPPSASTHTFLPTLPPLKKPMGGYFYNKPAMTADAPPPMEMDHNPDFQGYNYDKPAPMMPEMPSKPDYDHGYHYSKPEPAAPTMDHPPSSYDHHGPPSYHHSSDPDYPELIFNKQHGGGGMADDSKGDDDMKGGDMGMVPPPPPPSDMKPDMDSPGPPMDDSGFPQDFPGDFKYHHDFDDHDFYHHHHHHTTTTTTTTEMPRVNRYSYYYLGKKLYYLPLYFSVYFIIYVGALIIKAVLRHKIVYPNSWRPNDQTASFFSKRSVDSWDLSNENLHEVTGRVTHAISTAAEKYMKSKVVKND